MVHFLYIHMWLNTATLIKKTPLTSDVFQLEYSLNEPKKAIPWQFITFLLPKIWGRAYSLAWVNDGDITLIVKRWDVDAWWRWGSMMLCDAELWDTFSCVGPAGTFTLTDNDKARCFIATGTWLPPLYYQINHALARWDTAKHHLVFWVRHDRDVFYTQHLISLTKQYPNFSFDIFLSQATHSQYTTWYVTEYLNAETTQLFHEYYICGSPSMIESAQNILHQHNVDTSSIFVEAYD